MIRPNLGLLFGLVASSGLLVGGCGRSTEMTVNGKAVSKEEAKQGLTESREVFANALDGKTSPAGGTVPKTEFGRFMKEFATKVAANEKWHEKTVEEAQFETIIAPPAFRSVQSLRTSLARLDKLEATEKEWMRRKKKILNDYYQALGDTRGKEAHLKGNLAQLDEYMEGDLAMIGAFRDYLNFGLEKRPTPDPKGDTILWSDADLPHAQRLIAKIEAKATALSKKEDAMRAKAAKGLQDLDNFAKEP